MTQDISSNHGMNGTGTSFKPIACTVPFTFIERTEAYRLEC